ncbi:CYTH domain-containing protein [Neobacillus dielmonensis]|uniref:CYTH domain-containing protein n=1 Tax=Neobacillus dielmonensis TaxID=1347369 RepID=UPI0005A767AC|nr:CYTH domain-containing protein [Neobacillus dielmonensis]
MNERVVGLSQSIEIEFKNMLTKHEYEVLLKKFNLDEKKIFSQENHYFDTEDFALKRQGCALRIRRKVNSFEMTLKQPAAVGLLETNQVLSSEEAKQAIQTGRLPSGNISEIIKKSGIVLSDIQYFGSLVTRRAEISYKQGLIVIDHSIYLDHEDYELEFEVNDYDIGKKSFFEILQSFGIPERKTVNKIQRFYNRKYPLTST